MKSNFLKFLKAHIPEFLLGSLCFAILVSHTFYVVMTHQFPEMDEHLYVGIASEFYKILQNPSWDIIFRMNQYLVDHPPFRPPVYPLTILPLLLVFGISNAYKLALWVNGIYFIATMIFLYFLAREYMSRTSSVIATAMFASFGWTLFYLHFTYSETATTTFIVLSTLLLVRSKNFENRKYSILFGLSLAFGILTRWVVPLFLLGPAIFIFARYFLHKKNVSKKILKNIALALLIQVPVVIFHYIDRGVFGTYVTSQAFPGPLWDLVPSQRRNLVSLQSAAYYFKVIEQLNIFFFVIFIAGLSLGIKKIKKYGLFVFGFLLPYLIFSFTIVIKDDRYIVPIYPFVALVCAIVIEEVRRKTLVIGVSILCALSFLGSFWQIGPLSTGLQSILVQMPIGHPRRIHLASMVWPPVKEFSNAKQIMKIISDDALAQNKKNPTILNLFSYHPLDNALFSINNYEKIDKFSFQNFVGSSPSAVLVADSLTNADYLLVKSGRPVDDYFPSNNYILLKIAVGVIIADTTVLDSFTKIATVIIPLDKSNVTIYKRDKAIEQEEKEEIVKQMEVILR